MKPMLKGFRLDKPLITAIVGYAIAGGTELVLASDIQVAAEGARLGLAEVRWGLFPLAGSSVRLPRQVPYTFAADLLLTGRQVGAVEAYQMGLVGHLVPDGQALPKALELAGLIAANGPVAVRNILRAMRYRGAARGRGVRGGNPDRAGDFRFRRREGGTARLHGEAPPRLHRR